MNTMNVYDLIAVVDQWKNRFSYWSNYCGTDDLPVDIFYGNLNTLFDFRLEIREGINWMPVDATVKVEKGGSNEIIFKFEFQVDREIFANKVKITNGTIEKEKTFNVNLDPDLVLNVTWKIGLDTGIDEPRWH